MSFLPQWPKHKWREGSEGASQQKTFLILCTAFSVLFLLLYSILFFGLFHTYAHKAFNAASGGLKLLSVLSALGSFYGLWKSPETKTEEKKSWYWIMFIGLFGAAWLFAYIEDSAF
jgi:hypothetical protein